MPKSDVHKPLFPNDKFMVPDLVVKAQRRGQYGHSVKKNFYSRVCPQLFLSHVSLNKSMFMNKPGLKPYFFSPEGKKSHDSCHKTVFQSQTD